MLLASGIILPAVCVVFISNIGAIVSSEQEPKNGASEELQIERLLLVTATVDENSERFIRFNKSVHMNKLDLIVLGSRDSWIRSKDGEFITENGLKKIDLFREALKSYKNEDNLLVMWLADSDNAIINGNKVHILNRFHKLSRDLRTPISSSSKDASFVGLAPILWNSLSEIEKRAEPGKDHMAELFQTLSSESEFELELSEGNDVKLKNYLYQTEPVIAMADEDNQRGKILLNSLGNYLAKAWTLEAGCRDCNATKISLSNVELPSILIGLFIEVPTPFLEDFFESLLQLNYSSSKMHLFLHNSVEYHHKQVEKFLEQFSESFASVEYIPATMKMLERDARNYGLEKCRKRTDCAYYFALDSLARLDNSDSLRILIEANKNVIAPMLTRPQKLWSNFWGSLNAHGYYSRSHDYVQLVKMERQGIWSVAHILNAYLIKGQFLRNFTSLGYSNLRLEPIHSFSHSMRELNQLQYMINTHDFGHLINPTSYNTSLKYPEFYQLSENMLDWEQRYLHDNYSDVLEDDYKIEEPCQDVFWFPLVNELFCRQAIEIMEAHGQWSGGTNHDPRIEGGYESVPTRDIHLRQVDLHELWLTFLREYVMPVQLKQYIGYEHDPPRADLAFVVRYHPAEQASLRPHHDSSTYTMNIALNSPGRDYQGGGCRFVRYNCSVVDSRPGWALIHPGRLTHYHEGLPVTNGTRYILVTFIDP